MELWIQRIADWMGVGPSVVSRLASTLAVLIVITVLKVVFQLIVRRRVKGERAAFHWRRAINYLLTAIGLILLVRIWVTEFSNLGTFLGLLGAGLAVALGDLLKDLAGWIFILSRRPFQIGDRIQIGEHMGDVIDIRLFNTYILECGNWVDADQSTGRMILLPNGMIFDRPVANFTRGFEHIWDEIAVLVTFESDWRRAKQILVEIGRRCAEPLARDVERQVKKTAEEHLVFFRNFNPIVYTSVRDSGVLLTLRYLTPARHRRGNQEQIWEELLDAYGKEDTIDFAYPSQRYFLNYIEGKPGARAEIPAARGPRPPEPHQSP